MINKPVAPFRQIEGYIAHDITRYERSEGYLTSRATIDEIWANIEQYSEITRTGKAFLLANGVGLHEVDKVYVRFRANIRQAKSYYLAAINTHYRSASLLYYYCFMNLLKAGIVLKRPSTRLLQLKHGIYINQPTGSIRSQTLNINHPSSGVLPIFYELYFGEPLRQRPIKIINLLGRITDIGTQYQQLANKPSKISSGYYSYVRNKSSESWSLLAIRGFDSVDKFSRRLSTFNSMYERTALSENLAKQIFDIEPYNLHAFTVFQSKSPIAPVSAGKSTNPFVLSDLFCDSLAGIYQDDVYASKGGFYISQPYTRADQAVLDETISIYMFMFYLSSLVRYYPEFLERSIDSSLVWLIDGFVNSAPKTFLLGASNWILNCKSTYELR